MKKYLLSTVLLWFVTMAHGQETVQWASTVMFVTSETSPLEYSAAQALHKPNVLPRGGENPNAWRPRKPDGQDYIVVLFENPIQAQQIAIAESENPGAISKVYAYDNQDNEHLLFELTPRAIPIESRLLNLFFEKTDYEIAYVRIDIDGPAVEGYNSIDAIGVSASNIPISVLIELASHVNHNVDVEQLSSNINSPYVEHSPLLSPDGKTLYFSRKFHPDNVGGIDDGEDIWYSDLDEKTGEWLPAKNLGQPLNTAGPNFISSITTSGDETILLLGNRYGKKGRMSQGISMSKRVDGGQWEKPVNLNVENDYNYSEKADYYMSASNDVIIMSTERDDTYGGRDLYATFSNGKGGWSEPINIEGNVNTGDEESAPFLDKDNRTLYFSSAGYSGYGGADIYVSKRLDDTWTKWSTPENLGPGINGPTDDVYFNIPSSGTHAYFTKGTEGENTDIFQFKIDEFFIEDVDSTITPLPDTTEVIAAIAEVVEPEVTEVVEAVEVVEPVAEEIVKLEPKDVFITIRGKVLNSKGNTPIGTRIIVERLPDGAEIGSTTSNASTGEYSFKLRAGARYGFLAEADGYISVNENVDLNKSTEVAEINRNLILTPIEKGADIVINNIFFDFNQTALKTASYPELQRILKFLQDNVIQRIEISGHTDSVGEDNYNLALSERRAKSVYDYFKKSNIIESRMVFRGYGESTPIVPNDTKVNRRKNRRVEFKIIE